MNSCTRAKMTEAATLCGLFSDYRIREAAAVALRMWKEGKGKDLVKKVLKL